MFTPDQPASLCWCFAAGCLDNRVPEHTITQEDYDAMVKHMLAGTCPDSTTIERIFPLPFEKIRATGAPVTLHTMWNYWLDHTEAAGEPTPRYISDALRIPEPRGPLNMVAVTYTKEGRCVTEPKHNFRSLPIVRGTRVITHGNVVSVLYEEYLPVTASNAR